jgi:hypothetical protein
MTDREVMQQALEALEDERYVSTHIVDFITALHTALEQSEQEPVAYYHPHKGFYWAKPTHISAPTVVDVPPVPLYVKWIAAQRPWQGLTDEDVNKESATINPQMKLAFHAGMYVAQQILKERNT